jgi:hypothetical protein
MKNCATNAKTAAEFFQQLVNIRINPWYPLKN